MFGLNRSSLVRASIYLLVVVLAVATGYTLWRASLIDVRQPETGDSIFVPAIVQDVTPTMTPTPDSRIKYAYKANSMDVAPNCGTVYFAGYVVDTNNRSLNDVTVELQFWDNRIYAVTGEETDWADGYWAFAPLSEERFQISTPFNIRLVESRERPLPISETLHIDFRTCSQIGQYRNITFVQSVNDVAKYRLPRFVQSGENFEVNLAGDSNNVRPVATGGPITPPTDEPVNIPEPITVVLFSAGLAGIALYGQKRKNQEE